MLTYSTSLLNHYTVPHTSAPQRPYFTVSERRHGVFFKHATTQREMLGHYKLGTLIRGEAHGNEWSVINSPAIKLYDNDNPLFSSLRTEKEQRSTNGGAPVKANVRVVGRDRKSVV